MSDYATPMVNQARKLHKAGWTPWEIAKILKSEHGSGPSYSTVKCWTDEEYATRRRDEGRDKERRRWSQVRGAKLGQRNHSPDFKLERMVQLRTAGLTFGAIAGVMAFDWPDDPSLTVEQVRYQVARRCLLTAPPAQEDS